jgi:hypothetical protein
MLLNYKEEKLTVKNSIDNLKAKFQEIIQEYLYFKNICILRGFNNSIPTVLNKYLINFDEKNHKLTFKNLIKNDNLNEQNGINQIFNNNNLSAYDKQKLDYNIKFDYLISPFNYESHKIFDFQEDEKKFNSTQIEFFLGSYFRYVLKKDKINLVISIIKDLFESNNIFLQLNQTSIDYLKLIEDSINKKIQEIISDIKKKEKEKEKENQPGRKLICYYISIITKEDFISLSEGEIFSDDFFNFDIPLIEKNLKNLWDKLSFRTESILGISIRLNILHNKSGLTYVLSNLENKEFVSSLISRGKKMNNQIKKDSNIYLQTIANTNPSQNNEYRNNTTINNTRTLNTTVPNNFDHIFEEFESKSFNVYVFFVDFEIKFNIDENLIFDYEKYQNNVDPTKIELGIVEAFVDKQIKNYEKFGKDMINNNMDIDVDFNIDINNEEVNNLVSKVLLKREEGINYKDLSAANDLIFLEKNKYLFTPERINYNIDEKLFIFLSRQFN